MANIELASGDASERKGGNGPNAKMLDTAGEGQHC
jgi:hypothetical protein